MLCALAATGGCFATLTACDDNDDSVSVTTGQTLLSDYNFGSAGGNMTVDLNVNGTWCVTTSASWISFSDTYGPDAQPVTITAKENNTYEERTATVIFKSGMASQTITITQDAAVEPQIEASMEMVAKDGADIKLTITAECAWTLSCNASFLYFDKTEGVGSDTVNVSFEPNPYAKERTATITLATALETKEFSILQLAGEAPLNANQNISDNEAALRLEIPHFNSANVFVPHYATIAGKKDVNYSIEWSNTMKHTTWVAYTYDANNIAKNVSRGENFVADPDLPSGSVLVDNSYHNNDGYDRGHLCPSGDRLYSTEVNDQTFYFTNMSPMLHNFNSGGIWQAVESEVRAWGELISSGKYDTVFVAKGGTLDKLLVNFTGTINGIDSKIPTTDANGYSVKGLPVPAYYFTAVLTVKEGKYEAIGFLLPHDDTLKPISGSSFTVADLKKYSLSIDDLEKETGIDFFCNLPDAVEDAIESELNFDVWKW